jgi:large subunit ribosomal protein L9
MKIILEQDVPSLGEIGDIKTVADGYARNYLLPKKLAVVCTPKAEKLFESRKAEIEAHKQAKRDQAKSLKEQLEAVEVSVTVPAGDNGKLYGAVTNSTVAEELLKLGFQIDRRKIEIADRVIKSAGKFNAAVKLYEGEEAQIKITVIGQHAHRETERKHDRREGRASPRAAQEASEQLEPHASSMEVEEAGQAASED